jgi:hypothetical protein
VNNEAMNLSLLKKPSAFLPIAMSLAALTIVLVHIALVGTAPERDEGAAAHMWQLLMVGQVPIMGRFTSKWMVQNVRASWVVLALQAAAAFAAFAPVYFLRL